MRIQKTFKDNNPIIYVIGTPIGNLGDISIRALEKLKEVDYILCEDTRTSQILLNKYEIKSKLISMHKFNEMQSVNKINELLIARNNLAIISDAGVPCISDPGADLLFELLKINNNFSISAINVGPAYVHTLVCSGIKDINQHIFLGFLSKKENKLKEEILNFLVKNVVLLFYESVHRIKNTIEIIESLNVECDIFIGREITKINEEFIFGTISEIKKFIFSEKFVEKGEFVLLLKGKFLNKEFNLEETLKEIHVLVTKGYKIRDAINVVNINLQIDKKDLYKEYINKFK